MTARSSSIFSPESPQAAAISHLFIFSGIVCAVIFAVVAGIIIYSLVRFRWYEGMVDPPQTSGNKVVEVVWTVIPFLIVILLMVLSLRAMNESDPPPSGPPDLVIVGHQWWWEVRYANTDVVTANEIHIPTGRPLGIRLDTADVLHEFWVPQLTRKMTTVPLRGNHIWIQADKPGIYEGLCSEFCGTQHAWMRFEVVAQSPADYEAWLRHQEAPAPKPRGREAEEGWRVFSTMTCIECHAIRGTDASGRAGPDLTHFASRRYFGAGVALNTPANLRRWLVDPQQIKPGAKMPDFNLTRGQIRDLVAYFETLQ